MLSTRLEGNQVALSDLLWYSLDGAAAEGLQAARGVVQASLNYVHAAERLLPAVRQAGIRQPLSGRRNRELYGGLKGRDEAPGNYRSSEDMDRAFGQHGPGCPFRSSASSAGPPG